MKSGVFDMPTRPDDAERHLATALAGALADDGETPGRWLFLVRLGDHGADRADFSFVGIQRLDVIDVPELHVFFPVRIVAALTPSLGLPASKGFLDRLVLFVLEHQEAAVAVMGGLSPDRPIGIPGMADVRLAEPS